jgi:hypothetical protein
MPSLSRDLRRLLEKTIAGENGARRIAEAGAEQSLQRLAVGLSEPHTSLTPDERALRNQLRAHGRQLGDRRDPQRGNQTITHLTQAVAYEHWHRLLFARFLAENDLLLHPEHGVALSLDEVKELALGLNRDWIEVAAEYAQKMLLREVFRPDDPALQVPLPPESRLELEGKLDSLPREIFLADDSLGWVYQFWQKDAKDEVNRSEVKIGADEVAPVTQLFTEDYIVLFLLENTLGAWWTSRRGAPDLPGYNWTYLRFNDDGSPSAGTFDAWPRSAKELKILDPCMGSGHFLTFALPILTRMRVAEEGSPLPQAVAAVLRDNLFGLELDPRCSQIAAFNLALNAWKLAGQHFELPPLNLACSGLGINAKEEEWVKLAGQDGRKQDLMRWLYSMFRNAPILGSLIDPRRVGKPMVEDEVTGLLPLLEEALSAERATDDTRELAIAAQGLLAAARILTGGFSLVATNVPYLGRGKQDDVLKEHCETFHGDAKADLATCFVGRALQACSPGGSVALVTPQNWLFLTSYKKLRERLLRVEAWNFVARLGEHAFDSPAAAGAFVALVGLTRRAPPSGHTFVGWDVSEPKTPAAKAAGLVGLPGISSNQMEQAQNPDCSLSLGNAGNHFTRLGQYASVYQGVSTTDMPRFVEFFWEQPSVTASWELFQMAPCQNGMSDFCGLLYWEGGKGELARIGTAQKGLQVVGKRGLAIAVTRQLYRSYFFGSRFDGTLAAVIPHSDDSVAAVAACIHSDEFPALVREVDQALSVTESSFGKVRFDFAHWQRVAAERYPTGLPKPHSDDPTQWLFDGRSKGASYPVQVAVARLLSYSWPRQTGSAFLDCPAVGPDGVEKHALIDGILCLSSVAGEDGAAIRLRAILQFIYGAEYSLTRLLEGKRSKTLDDWLRDEFFEEHCAIFQHRPFIWHIWDGLKDGFHVLVNYHKLDRKNLEKLIYSYLGDWLTRQRQGVANGVEGADTRLAASEHLQDELKRILQGESPYDIFARWKPLKQQRIGWDPDLNDGVRVNIRPWITAATLYRAAKPGILRVTPNIKYGKDRGKEPARDPKDFPWFKGSTDRINDRHLSLEEKRRARGLL